MELAVGRADSAWTPSSTMPCTRAKSDSRATTMDACTAHKQSQIIVRSPTRLTDKTHASVAHQIAPWPRVHNAVTCHSC
jgi:hypothetical protein